MGVCMPLIASDSKLRMHFKESESILNAAVDDSVQLRIATNTVQARVIGSLAGSGCEYIPRNRGSRIYVAPLLCLRSEIWVWLGYYEEWEGELCKSGTREYAFGSSDFPSILG